MAREDWIWVRTISSVEEREVRTGRLELLESSEGLLGGRERRGRVDGERRREFIEGEREGFGRLYVCRGYNNERRVSASRKGISEWRDGPL